MVSPRRCRLDRRRRYLTFVDRACSTIRVGSTTVYPPTVELRLYGLPCIADAAVGEVDGRLVAAVVAEPGCEPQPAAILASLRESLPAAAVPTEVKTVEAIPRNAAGKVRRDELRALLVAEGSVGGERVRQSDTVIGTGGPNREWLPVTSLRTRSRNA